MPFVMKSPQINYINNKETENFLVSEDDDYNFKYVPADHFKNIVKHVRRQRCQEDEDRVWSKFVRQQELNGLRLNKNNIHPSVQNVESPLFEDTNEVDRELMRLEEDALPERNKRIYSATGMVSNRRIESENTIPETKPEMKDSGTGSSNILLAIPEEEISYSYEESSKHEQNAIATVRNSTSAYAIRQKSNYLKRVFDAADNVDYDSSLDPSTRDDSDYDEGVFAQIDPIVAHKILLMQKRVSELLDEILFRLERISLPDGEKDLKRRQQRVMEFAIRFSRNYLYDINRHVSDVQRHVRAISPHAKVRTNHRSIVNRVQSIEHKLMSVYQLLLQALNAYCKHIPTSVYQGHPGKLKDLLEAIMKIKDICDTVQLNTDYFGSGDTNMSSVGNQIEKQCNAILVKLTMPSEKEWQRTGNNPQVTFPSTLESVYVKKKHDGKQLVNRLSMYSIDVKASKFDHKRRTSLGQQKDRKRGNKDMTNLSVNRASIMEQPHPSPATESSSKQHTQVETKQIHQREDDIKTMMDFVPPDTDNSVTLEEQTRRDNTTAIKVKPRTSKRISNGYENPQNSMDRNQISKASSSVSKNDNSVKPGSTIIEEQLSNLVPVIADLMSLVTNKKSNTELKPVSSTSVETLMEFLQKYQPPNTSTSVTKVPTNSCQNSVCANYDYLEGNSTKTVSDVHKCSKNMKLICMESTSDTPRYCDASCQANCDTVKKIPNCETNGDSKSVNTQSRKATVPLIISDSAEFRLQQWQKEYQRYCQSSPMYSSSTQNKPWDIVAWISDKLVDELIIEIAKELQMDEVIQKLFEMEFQEF